MSQPCLCSRALGQCAVDYQVSGCVCQQPSGRASPTGPSMPFLPPFHPLSPFVLTCMDFITGLSASWFSGLSSQGEPRGRRQGGQWGWACVPSSLCGLAVPHWRPVVRALAGSLHNHSSPRPRGPRCAASWAAADLRGPLHPLSGSGPLGKPPRITVFGASPLSCWDCGSRRGAGLSMSPGCTQEVLCSCMLTDA